ncbi:hypothetical protein HZ994_14760 [Akkermansiaceae bacterium]|nr:hypothetical protein HZ994_14760 [Akkermansiaceae bacterium]
MDLRRQSPILPHPGKLRLDPGHKGLGAKGQTAASGKASPGVAIPILLLIQSIHHIERQTRQTAVAP